MYILGKSCKHYLQIPNFGGFTMNINVSKGRRSLYILVFALLLYVLLSALAPSAYAVETGSINVEKNWQTKGNALPESVTLYLNKGNATVSTLVLSPANARQDGAWAGSFENVPLYDDAGQAIDYTIDEMWLEGYDFSVLRQPRAESLEIRDIGEKITPASESRYSVGSANMIVANKGGEYYLWTESALSDTQKPRLLSAINQAGLQGFGKDLRLSNTAFQSGLPAYFDAGVTVGSDSGVYVDFEDTNVWSLFYAGVYEIQRAQSAVVLNTAQEPAATPSPSASPIVSPTPTIQPSPTPSAPPETGNTGIEWVCTMLSASLLALFILVRKLKAIW